MLKKIALFTFISALLGTGILFIFEEALLLEGAKWTCQYLSKHYLQGNFHYEKAQCENGCLIFSDVEVCPFQAGQNSLKVRELRVKCSLTWPHLDLNVQLLEPELSLTKGSLAFNESFPRLLFKIRGELKVTQGVIVLNEAPERYLFDVDIEYRKHIPLRIATDLRLFSNPDNWVKIRGNSLSKEGDKQFTVHLHQMQLPAWIPLWKHVKPTSIPWEVSEGSVDGQLTYFLLKGQNSLLEGEIDLKHITYAFPAYRIEGKNPHVHLHLARQENHPHLSRGSFFEKMVSSLSGTLSSSSFQLKTANLDLIGESLVEFSPCAPMQIHCTGKIQKELTFQLDGCFEHVNKKITWKGDWEGLSGGGEVNWNGENSTLFLKGVPKKIVSLFPTGLKEKIQGVIGEDSIRLVLKCLKNEMVGELQLKEEILHFGTSVTSDPQVHENCQTLVTYFPQRIFHPPTVIKMGGLQFENCWFKATDINFAKFFPTSLKISTQGDIQGYFDTRRLFIMYHTKEIGLENQDFSFLAQKKVASACHYIDLETNFHCGMLPIHKGVYVQKNPDLHFNEIAGTVLFENKQIMLKEAEGFTEGLFLQGEVHLASEKDPFLLIQADLINGKVSQMQQFISKFAEIPKIPLEGDLAFRQSGAKIELKFNPLQAHAHVCGSIYNGKVAFESENLNLQDVSMNFDFNSKTKIFSVSDLEALLLVGSPAQMEIYDLIGDYIVLKDFDQAEFDVWVSDKSRDIVRFVGAATHAEPNHLQVKFNNQLTHFGNVHPLKSTLILKDWGQIESLDLKCKLNLNTFLPDLVRLKEIPWLSPLDLCIQSLQSIQKTTGEFEVEINYDKPKEEYHFMAKGQELHFDSLHFETCLLKGRKKENLWSIDQLQLDQLCLSADILHKENTLFLNFLGIGLDETLLAGLEGRYEKGEFYGKVKLLELNLAHLQQWHRPLEFFKFKGWLHASGDVVLKRPEHSNHLALEVSLDVGTKKTQLRANDFDLKGKFNCSWTSSNPYLQLELDAGAYHLLGKDLQLEKIKIRLDSLGWDFYTCITNYSQPLWFNAHSASLTKGEAFLSDYADRCHGIGLNWQIDPEQRFLIKQVTGTLLETQVDLIGEGGKSLNGSIQTDLAKVAFLFPEVSFLKNEAQGKCVLTGKWELHSNSIHFSGDLKGENCTIQDHLLATVEANLDCSPAKILATQIRIDDPAGKLEIPQILIEKNQHFFIPQLHVQQFRPNLLRNRQGQLNPLAHSFLIKNLEINEIRGNLTDLKQLTGNGKLTFANSQKQDLSKDSALLTPISGNIYYTIQDGKILLTKFREIYSAGKLSKFNLINSAAPSYVDFDGNLHVQMRLKQYNQLFKLAELFTVTIQGTLQKPVYTFNKQSL